VSSEAGLRELIREAAEDAIDDNDEAAAVACAEGYKFPERYLASDVKLLKASALDFEVMVRRRQRQLAPDRLSLERLSFLGSDNPEMMMKIDLAGGMRVFLAEDFTPNDSLPRNPLRDLYIEVSTAMNKMLEQKLAFLLLLEMAQRHFKRLHLCEAHWTNEKGKPLARPLGNLSGVDGTPINTDDTAATASAFYAKILHPTIDDIAVMIYDFWREACGGTLRGVGPI
jgi:hypothetical protein